MQRLLGEAVWDADAVREDLRGYMVDVLGDPGVLVIEDTGALKKGTCSAGVQPQYTGTAGRMQNSQVAVVLAYATADGCALVDREIYLPRCWSDDPARCAAAAVPEQVGFATKVTLARRMLTDTVDAGVPAAWATAEEFYGGDRHLGQDLHTRGIGYILAVTRMHRVTACPVVGPAPANRLAADLAARTWNRASAGNGFTAHRD
jgi:SRSO17 transposase